MSKKIAISFFCFIFSLFAVAQDESEPNNNFSQANEIGFGNVVSAFINPSGDDDYFKFNVTEPGVIRLEIKSVPSNIDLRSRIYLPNQATLIRSRTSSNEGQAYVLEVSTCETGFHYLYLEDGSSGSNNAFNSSEAYQFEVKFIPFSEVDKKECNNSFSEAAEIISGEEVDALIAPWFDDGSNPFIDDRDFYKINVPGPGIIRLRYTQVPSNIDLDTRFYLPNQQTLIRSNTSAGEGQTYTLTASTCSTGFHYIYVEDGTSGNNSGFNSSSQYSFSVEFIPFSEVDKKECNNSFSEAAEIVSGEIVDALIAPWFDDGSNPFIDDRDFYKINVPEPGIIRLRYTQVPSNIDLDTRFYLPNQQTLIRSNTSAGEGQTYTLTASTCITGFHYIYVEDGTSGSNSNFNSSSQYSFSVEFIPFSEVDKKECNNSFSEAAEIGSGEVVDALIAPWFDDGSNPFIDDKDFYKINVPEPGIIRLRYTQVPSNIDLDTRFYLPNQQTLIRSNTSAGEGQTYNLTASTCITGFHYIYIEDGTSGNNSDFNFSSQYSFSVEFIPFSEVDKKECNNSFSEAAEIVSGEVVDALIAPWFDDGSNPFIDDKDYYKINVPEPGIIRLRYTQVPSNIDLDTRFYLPNQQTLIRSNTSANEGQSYTLTASTCITGFHYIYIEDGTSGNNSDFNFNSQYSFSVEFIPFSEVDKKECNNSFSEAAEIVSGEVVDALIAPWFDDGSNPFIDDKDYYKINITEPGIIRLRLLTVPSNIDMDTRFYLPNQQTLIRSRTSSNEGQGYILEASTCTIGSHYIFMEDGTAGNNSSFNTFDQYSFRVDFLPFSSIDEAECNNAFSDAFQVNLCDTIDALIAPFFDDGSNPFVPDIDFYKFELNDGRDAEIVINSIPDGMTLRAELYNGNQSLITSRSGTNAIDFTLTNPEAGTYFLKVSETRSRFNAQDTYQLFVGCNLVTNTYDLAVANAVQAYPNPLGDVLNLKIDDLSEKEIAINITDLAGKSLYQEIKSTTAQISINTSSFPPGVYLLNLRMGKGKHTIKLVR